MKVIVFISENGIKFMIYFDTVLSTSLSCYKLLKHFPSPNLSLAMKMPAKTCKQLFNCLASRHTRINILDMVLMFCPMSIGVIGKKISGKIDQKFYRPEVFMKLPVGWAKFVDYREVDWDVKFSAIPVKNGLLILLIVFGMSRVYFFRSIFS